MGNAGLPRLGGGIARREREAWVRPCVVHAKRGEDRPAAAVIETVNGPQPICSDCIPQAERLDYPVRREPLS